MGLVNQIVKTIIARMSKEDKQRLIVDMTDKFLADMTIEEKQEIVSNIMNKFFSDMTIEDKKKIMSEVTPQMMEGFDIAVIMPQVMMAMLGQHQQKDGAAGTMPMGVNITGRAKESSESPGQQEEGGKK
jgi:hypothetical protein